MATVTLNVWQIMALFGAGASSGVATMFWILGKATKNGAYDRETGCFGYIIAFIVAIFALILLATAIVGVSM